MVSSDADSDRRWFLRMVFWDRKVAGRGRWKILSSGHLIPSLLVVKSWRKRTLDDGSRDYIVFKTIRYEV